MFTAPDRRFRNGRAAGAAARRRGATGRRSAPRAACATHSVRIPPGSSVHTRTPNDAASYAEFFTVISVFKQG
jgi:hypothetical protein